MAYGQLISTIDSSSQKPVDLFSSSGNLPIRIATSDVLPPEANFSTETLSMGAGTGTQQTSSDLTGYTHGIINVTVVGIDTVALTGYLDAALSIETTALTVYTTAQAVTVASALTTGTYYIKDLAVSAIRSVKTGTAGVASVSLAMKS